MRRLIHLLNKEIQDTKKVPKVIIFVKDRVVAQYLKNILELQVEKRKDDPSREDYLDSRYRVSMAMGPRGKNLVNKAFRSTKHANPECQEDDTLDTSEDASSIFSGQNPMFKNTSQVTKDLRKL